MSLRPVWLAVLPLLLVAGPASAQTTRSLDELRRIAEEQATGVEVARAQMANAEIAVSRAWALVLPRVVAQGSYTRNDREIAIELPSLPGLPTGDSPVFQPLAFGAVSVELTTRLLDLSLFPLLDAARRGEDAAEETLDATRAAVGLAVTEVVHRIVAVDALVEAAHSSVSVRESTVESIRARRLAGVGTDFDVTRAESELLVARNELQSLADARSQLLRALGELIGEPLDPATVFLAPEAPVFADTGADGLVAEALESRHEREAALLQLDATMARTDGARAGYLPTLVAQGQYRLSTEEAIDGERSSWQVALALQWVLADRGLRRATITESEVATDLARARLDELDRRIEREVRDAVEALDARERDLAVAIELESLSETALAQARVAWEEGALPSLDLLGAESSLDRARAHRIGAGLERDLAAWRLHAAVGRPAGEY